MPSASSTGTLQVTVLSSETQFPIPGANVQIYDPANPSEILADVSTDASGQTELLTLPTPPLSYSQSPGKPQPFADYSINIRASGFFSVQINGSELFAETVSRQSVRLTRTNESSPILPDQIDIPPNTLFGDYPPKIPEDAIKPIRSSGEIVLSRVVVPQTIVVHDGTPSDSNAPDYYVPYRDYIKNVACSEIYATWPRATIIANVLAILSFTLNRVYTEWYRSKGYNFTITSSTAYDHKWIYGRNIFQEISVIVDEIFDQYLSFPNVRQPILTQYCDGRQVTCPQWMSQWGSKALGDAGYSPIEILRNYYGNSIYINTAEEISGIPTSWPGYDLTIGSSGQKVRQLQEQLNVIAGVYSAIPTLTEDGIYGAGTAAAVREFQSIFGLPQTGVTDFSTWYRISQIYVGVTGIAELNP